MLLISMHLQNFVKIHPVVLKILSRNEILKSIKGHIYVCYKVAKIDLLKSIQHLPNINAYETFGQILLICSPDIEQKRNYNIN